MSYRLKLSKKGLCSSFSQFFFTISMPKLSKAYGKLTLFLAISKAISENEQKGESRTCKNTSSGL